MPHHTEDDDNVGSQPSHVTPGSQSGSLCMGSDKVVSKVLILTKKEPRRMCEACEQENSKFGSTNNCGIEPGL